MYSEQLRLFSRQTLAAGIDHWGLELGIVSHIEDGIYVIVEAVSLNETIAPGSTFPLNSTYCREVFEKEETVAYTHVQGIEGMRRHPLYPTNTLEVYIGSPIWVEGKVWGTLNFTSKRIRSEEFSQKDIAYLEQQAEKVAALLSE